LLSLAPLLVCGAARREYRLGMAELILSKPPSSEVLIWGKFLGALAAVLLLIVAAVGGALLAEAFSFRGESALLPTVVGGLRVVLPALFVAGLSFALAIFARSAMVAALVIGLVVVISAGKAYL